MNKAFLQLVLIRYKEFSREPGIIFWTILFPVLMAWGLGMAFSGNNEMVQSLSYVEDSLNVNTKFRSFLNENAEISETTEGEPFYVVQVEDKDFGNSVFNIYPTDSTTASLNMKKGKSLMILFESSDSLVYYFDPHNSDAKLSYLILDDVINNNKNQSQSVIKPITLVGSRYIDFLIPGLLALGIMNSFLWGISYALIDMRVKKLMRRMIATPMKRSHFLISHFFARISLAIVEAFILIGFSKFFFDITIQGGLAAFFVIFLAGNIAFTGIGVLISSRTSNSRVGTGIINLISLPMTILSGIFFSYHNFPDAAVKVIKVLPLTILADNLRGVFIEGSGVLDVIPGSIVLLTLGAICFSIGLRIFKWY